MLFLYGNGSGSLIDSRQTAPILAIFLVLLLIVAVVVFIAILLKKQQNYYKSENYITKEQNRPTKRSDITKLAKQIDLNSEDQAALWEVCQATKCNNIIYLLKSNAEVVELFRNAYEILKENQSFTTIKMNRFFNCLFKLEMMVAQNKKLYSTQQIPELSIIFYINDEGEQYPFTVVQNIKDFFTVELPEFVFKSPRKPALLVRSRFNYKTPDGLSYNFISRLIRYDENEEGKYKAVIAHTDQLQSQSQRHFRREFFSEKCVFASAKLNKNAKKDEEKFIYSEKIHMGKLSNISAGGCCIQTDLPVKDKQYICVSLPSMGIKERLFGVIKNTRKLPTGLFALHIQFVDISLESQNKIFTLVYKFEL